jgi:nicotinate dehydrogenase subunit B
VSAGPTRRTVLRGAGALVVGFALSPAIGWADAETQSGVDSKLKLPGSLKVDPWLDAWIRVDAEGGVQVFTGKAELGQGAKTALLQVAAEELSMPLHRIRITTADTGLTVNEGFTAGSHTIQDSGTAIRNAAAQVREILIAEAARRLGLAPDQLTAGNGEVTGPNGAKIGYGDLVSTTLIHVQAQPVSKLKQAKHFTVMNTSVPRVDIPPKVTGGAIYVQDMVLPGMLHARVVRPPSYQAVLKSFDRAAIQAMPGVVTVIRNGNFLAVVGRREFQTVKAMRALAASAEWQETASLPDPAHVPAMVLGLKPTDYTILDRQQDAMVAGVASVHEATYTRPYQSHGSIGPSCAVGHFENGMLTVWTHTQGVYPDRDAIAEMLHLPKEQVRCIHTQGSGCYGHNGADDAAGDAGLLAMALPGTPIRVQFMREQEHAWEPFGPAMVTKAKAALDDTGAVVDWEYEVWSNTHNMRPGGAGALLTAQLIDPPFAPPPPKPLPQPEGGGDRNGIPLYVFPNAKVVHHFLPEMPIRVSALRSLGAYMNVFSIESFMDELALAAKTDPVAFRLRHLQDQRGRDAIQMAAEKFGWAERGPSGDGRGFGFAFARYKNLAAYCAIACEIAVEHETGRLRVKRVVAAVDTGEIINPDGVRNQIEGAIIQSTSWAVYEGISFDRTRITSVDWSTYPILRFHSVPDSIEVHLIDRPGTPFLGAGETGQGPTGAAVANALADATGKRLRDLPLSPEKVKAAIGV